MQKRIATFCIFLLFFLLLPLQGLKSITFSASCRGIKDLSKPEFDGFGEWFQQISTKELILNSNPGIERVERLSTEPQTSEFQYLAQLSPLKFPGLLVRTQVKLTCDLSHPTEMIVTCQDENIQREYEGSQVLASLVSKLFPEVRSTCLFLYLPQLRQLENRANLTIQFSLPSWLPMKGSIIERKGSEIIARDLEKDLKITCDRIIANYQSSSPSIGR